ncbi:MAG: dihydropteroate synthase [Nitrospirales bacterium]
MNQKTFPTHWQACTQRIPLESRTLLMGILNVTPDSFSDGGTYFSPQRAVDHLLSMIEEGAEIIDIGGESTRPGALPVDEQEEIRRLKPVLEAVGHRSTVPISIDTRKASVAKMALDLGAIIVNDISGLRDDVHMAKVVAETGAGLVLMHKKGRPETMQDSPEYNDVVGEVKDFLAARVEVARKQGIALDQIVLDPGIGFGKSVPHNILLVSQCAQFLGLGLPIMVGVSNKAFIGKIIDKPVEARAFGTATAVAIAIFQGAHIVRVHDVGTMRDVRDVAVTLRNSCDY